MCEVYPASLTLVNWSDLKRVYDDSGIDLLGRLEGTYLHKADMQKADPASIIGCLDTGAKNALLAFKQPTIYWKHLTFSFFIVTRSADSLMALSSFVTVTSEYVSRKYLAFASGTLFDWFQLLYHIHTKPDIDTETRELGNGLINHFENSAIKEIFNKYTKVQMKDGTFTWKVTQ